MHTIKIKMQGHSRQFEIEFEKDSWSVETFVLHDWILTKKIQSRENKETWPLKLRAKEFWDRIELDNNYHSLLSLLKLTFIEVNDIIN